MSFKFTCFKSKYEIINRITGIIANIMIISIPVTPVYNAFASATAITGIDNE